MVFIDYTVCIEPEVDNVPELCQCPSPDSYILWNNKLLELVLQF